MIYDHNEASTKDQDTWKMQRVASMMTILDDVKARIQKSQSSSKRELRRCNTDLKPNRPGRDKKAGESSSIPDDKDTLRKALSTSFAARKALEMMCSSLGKEKEIIASELARKVQQLNGMEELLADLKAQNEILLAKVQACASEHKERRSAGETQGNAALQERNKELSEQLLKSLDGYRSLKRKYRDVQEENNGLHNTIAEIEGQVKVQLESIWELKARMNEQTVNHEEEISAIEHALEDLTFKTSQHREKKDCSRP